jgi:voltage-gated potassium channel Kch
MPAIATKSSLVTLLVFHNICESSSYSAYGKVITPERSVSTQPQVLARETQGEELTDAPPLVQPMQPSTWTKERENPGSFASAFFFILLIGSLPISINLLGEHVSKVHIIESVCLYLWLFGGLYLFTHVILFQSPHFNGEIRTLDLRESVYFFAQIVTTVGYGDITPAKTRGRFFVGISVFIAIGLVAKMLSSVSDMVHDKVEGYAAAEEAEHLADAESGTVRSEKEHADRHKLMLWQSFQPVLKAGSIWMCFMIAGACFFHYFPGEGKSWAEGFYMSLITLSTVGFGVFTPVTKGGMVFASYWMVGGSAALVSTLGSYIAFSDAVKKAELAAAATPKATPKTTPRA